MNRARMLRIALEHLLERVDDRRAVAFGFAPPASQ
jgi:hypothetical protein